MTQPQLSTILLDQSKDLFWMVDLELQLIYANKSYLNLMREMTGVEKKLNEPILVEGFGEGYIEKWKAYYTRVLNGESFEIEEHYSQPQSNDIYYGQIIFEPLTDAHNKIFAAACQSKDITKIVKHRSEGNQLMDASLDVICTINEFGNFVYVSAASLGNWGYAPQELVGKPYMDLIVEEDLPKTIEAATAILKGQDISSFVNRYKHKNGGIAHNLWSARWDENTKLLYCVAKDGKGKVEQDEIIVQSEQRFKALVQEGADMISIIDSNGKYIYTSPTTTAILGITPEEFDGNAVWDFIHPDDIERARGYMLRILTESKVVAEPFRLKAKNKEWRWIETVLTNMLDNTAVLGIVANSRDITEQIEQDEKILQSEQRFKALVQEGSDLIGILDINGVYRYISPTSTTILGFTPEQLVGKNPFDFLHRDDVEKTLASLKKVVNEQKVLVEPFRFQNSKKEWRWIETVLTNMMDNPAVNGIVANSRDITEKIEEKQRLKLLESVVTSAKDAILITEAESYDFGGPRIIYANEAFCKMTGYEAAEVIGNSPGILHGPNSDIAELTKLGNAIKNWQSCEITVTNYKKSGEEYWVNFTIQPVADDKGWYTHWIAIERDVTEQKIKEQQKELLTQISINFSSENNLSDAAKELCKTIHTYGNFDLVEVWTANREKTHMQLFSHYLADPTDERFYEYTVDINSFKIAESLVGNVWSQQKQLVWDDVENQNGFARHDAAYKIGLKAVLGIPLIFNNEAVGVLNIGSKKGADHLKKYTPVFKHLEDFIGSELNRKKLENDLNHLFDSIPDILCLADFEGRFLKINKAGCVLLGYTEEEILYNAFDKFAHPDDKDIFTNEMRRLEHRESNFTFENRCVTKTGEIVWLSWYCNSSLEEGLTFATAKNITERKKAEVSIVKANERFEKVTEATNDAIWDWDLVNETYYRSNAIERFFGKKTSKLFTTDDFWEDNFHPEDVDEVRDSIGEAIANPLVNRWEKEYRVFNEEGKILHVSDRGVITRNKEGKAIRMVGAMTNTTEQKQMILKVSELNKSLQQYAAELERSNEELEQFAFVASHDLQEPLRMISSFMDQLNSKYKDQLDERGKQYIYFATDGAKRMKQIILDLLEYSRSSRPTEGKETVDLNELFFEFKKLRRKIIEDKKAIITANELPVLHTYKAALIQILHCLLDNAIKYSADGTVPIIEVNANEHEKEWLFLIKDNGIGIDPQFFEKIFVIFQRLHNKEDYAGSGIGLSIAKRHVEFLGGKIWVESLPRLGSTFYFTIPKK